jgi:histone-lysine N-methyltransferase SETD8
MHKQNQEESASDESLKKVPNCVAKLVKLENYPCIIILAFKDISKYVELLFDYGNRSKASIWAHPWLDI